MTANHQPADLLALVASTFAYCHEADCVVRIDGKPLNAYDCNGYRITYVGGRMMKLHRITWMLCRGEPVPRQIDHINGDRADNRIDNLRSGDSAGNSRNRRVTAKRTQEVVAKGVYRDRERYRAAIYVNDKRVSIGSHPTVDEAAHAYNKAAIALYGEYACLNPVGSP